MKLLWKMPVALLLGAVLILGNVSSLIYARVFLASAEEFGFGVVSKITANIVILSILVVGVLAAYGYLIFLRKFLPPEK